MQLRVLIILTSGRAIGRAWAGELDGDGSGRPTRRNTGLKVLLVSLGVATLVLLSLFLFKMWQKKKREEQHARLLKLFEEDDELEVEFGLRDQEIFLEQ
ncbi:hypothetical protein MUK42_23225 [Musa troglodytarum]|uniref:Transmembrane protein n=1 Tax=Musa troglodytarum TaxID=320322 RepID=A0A9E7EXN9_9LILI|nr:hypothetical protein MUK42_23225 [Musa troglodytarum]